MKRLAIFAHFEPTHRVGRHVLYLLRHLRQECDQLIFVSTSSLDASSIESVRPYAAQTMLKENVGMDFGMWKYALERIDLTAWDQLVLSNSSVIGPLSSLRPSFQRMDRSSCDFWGMTDSVEVAWHLQSYFLVFKEQVLRSRALADFFGSVLPYRNKHQIIRSYELGLTCYLMDQGFKAEAHTPTERLSPRWSWRAFDKTRENPTLAFPCELIEQGMPFVKVELLRDNPRHVSLHKVYRALQEHGYDVRMLLDSLVRRQ